MFELNGGPGIAACAPFMRRLQFLDPPPAERPRRPRPARTAELPRQAGTAERRTRPGLVPDRYMLPFFPAVLAAMYLGALTASNVLVPPRELPVVLPPAPEKIRTRPEISSAFLREPEDLKDEVMELCLKSESRQWALDFFALLCGSSETARIILEESERRGVSPSLAFALCWEESRYDSQAVNRRNRNGSVDRGLFQLNSASFPALGEADFFNPRTNAYYGIAHLRLCLDAGASEIAALAMYNAGAARVRADGTPRQTLDYADRVLSSRRKIDALFRGEWAAAQAAEQAAAPVEPEEPVELPPPAFPPLILSPLSR